MKISRVLMTLILLFSCLFSVSCATQDQVEPVVTQVSAHQLLTRKLVEVKVYSPGLEGNLLGDPAKQQVVIYLPPSYETSPSRHYPVLYLLHGSAGQIGDWTDGAFQEMMILTTMDDLISAGAIGEMIVIMPNGRNVYLGSFYLNSTVTGNWEDFITRDLVSYIDSNFRTIPQAASRGIAGHSMGGYGAIVLGLKHPDIFSAVYGLSPCCLAMEADLGPDNPAWLRTLSLETKDQLRQAEQQQDFYVVAFTALAAAFSPNPGNSPFFVDYPFKEQNGRLQRNEPAFAKWQENFPINMVSKYRSNLLKLQGIYFDYGVQEQFSNIPIAAPAFSQLLAKHGISHIFEVYQGDHRNRIRKRMETRVLPFFSRTLKFEP